jgi:hypothetical protein
MDSSAIGSPPLASVDNLSSPLRSTPINRLLVYWAEASRNQWLARSFAVSFLTMNAARTVTHLRPARSGRPQTISHSTRMIACFGKLTSSASAATLTG